MQSRMLSRPPPRGPDGGASHLWLDGHSILVHPFSFRTRKLSRITFAFGLSCASRREKRSLSTTPFLPNSANSGEFRRIRFPLFPCILGRAPRAPLPFHGGQPLLPSRQPARNVPPVQARRRRAGRAARRREPRPRRVGVPRRGLGWGAAVSVAARGVPGVARRRPQWPRRPLVGPADRRSSLLRDGGARQREPDDERPRRLRAVGGGGAARDAGAALPPDALDAHRPPLPRAAQRRHPRRRRPAGAGDGRPEQLGPLRLERPAGPARRRRRQCGPRRPPRRLAVPPPLLPEPAAVGHRPPLPPAGAAAPRAPPVP